MSGRGPDNTEETVPVEPPVHIEVFPTHQMAMWKADSLARFLAALDDLDSVAPTAPIIVDDTSTAGRKRHRVTDLEPGETVRYLRAEPDTPWTLSWERRTWPVVSVSGTPSPVLCRRLHTRTTDCDRWPEETFDTLVRALDRSDDG